MEDDIWELRPEFRGMEYRYFYATLAGQRVVILHVITKNTQRLRRRNIEIARRR
ncbi:MAG: type II toxin-antitoxin system RelE/ParE family toxin [Nitrospinae bacterium]|nr:type II toxin-antitoxin system RelE/ParE family toxin [Nitrospinota bacterium]